MSYPEWHTRGRHKLAHGHAEMGETSSLASHEDAEDDDPAEDDDSDRCSTGDDHMVGGPVFMRDFWERDRWAIGNEDDAERSRSPSYHLDHTSPLFVMAANDRAEARTGPAEGSMQGVA